MDNGAAPDKNPVEQALDVFVYAPLGLALEARSLMPRLIERGRNQVTMARMIGKFAVKQGQSETTKVLGKAGEQASAVLSDLGLLPRETPDDGTAGPESAAAPDAPAEAPPASAATVAPPVLVSDDPAAAPPDREMPVELAIADFDSLAASQVIPRLPGLSPVELEAVRSYEALHRGRKTVLNRIAQLQSA